MRTPRLEELTTAESLSKQAVEENRCAVPTTFRHLASRICVYHAKRFPSSLLPIPIPRRQQRLGALSFLYKRGLDLEKGHSWTMTRHEWDSGSPSSKFEKRLYGTTEATKAGPLVLFTTPFTWSRAHPSTLQDLKHGEAAGSSEWPDR